MRKISIFKQPVLPKIINTVRRGLRLEKDGTIRKLTEEDLPELLADNQISKDELLKLLG